MPGAFMTVPIPIMAESSRLGDERRTPPAAPAPKVPRISIKDQDMRLNSGRFAIRASLLAAVMAASAPGCGDDTGLAKRYPVSGTVTYKGQPVEKGRISFIPATPEGRSAAGQVEGGRYSLTTMSPGDGAIPGKYKVTVLAQEIDDSELKAIAKGGQYHHDKAFAKAVRNAKALVPSKYALAETSGIEREVAARTNRVDIDLTD